jgi:predicted RNase H-like nuclease (RuvC/YqgF family)
MSKTVSDQVTKAEMLISGLKKHPETAKKINPDAQAIAELESETQALGKQNRELERIMEEARRISKDTNRKLVNVRTMYQAIKKKIKLSTESSQWEQVGIMDRR